MKSKILFFIFTIILIPGYSILSQTDYWQRCNFLSTCMVRDIKIDNDDIIYALTDYGLFVSTDDGKSWEQNKKLEGNVNRIACNSRGYLFGVGSFAQTGVYISKDKGQSWSHSNFNMNVLSILITKKDIVFVGTDDGLYRSTDDGNSWVMLGFKDYLINTLTAGNWENLYAGCVSEGSGHIFTSTNDGDKWNEIKSFSSRCYVKSLAISSKNNIFVGGTQGCMNRSLDSGKTWVKLGVSIEDHMAISINSSDLIFVGTEKKGIYRSINEGETWIQINTGLKNMNISSLALNSKGFMFAGTDDGVYVSNKSTIPKPAATSLVTPSNGQKEVTNDFTFGWNEVNFATGYRLQISVKQNFDPIFIDQGGISTNSYPVNNLSYSSTYYWRVMAENVAGTSDWSSVLSFETISRSQSNPKLVKPENGAKQYTDSKGMIMFSWNSYNDARDYHLQIAVDVRFNNIVIDKEKINGTWYNQKNLDDGRLYYWRVKANTNLGYSNWSGIWNFTTTKIPPPPPTPPSVNRWAVIIGISQYQHPGIGKLEYADVDAKAFYDFLISQKNAPFKNDNVKLLLNQEATKSNIERQINDYLSNAAEEDLVIIYYAGHGARNQKNKENNFLMTYDTDLEFINSTSYLMDHFQDAITRYIKAKKVIVFADVCHGSGLLSDNNTRESEEKPLINSYLLNMLNAEDTKLVFTASGKDQTSVEGKSWGGGHGVFTWCLLEGMKGEADGYGGAKKDKQITLGELIGYTQERVQKETHKKQQPAVGPDKYDKGLVIHILK